MEWNGNMKERVEHIKECLSLLRQKLKCFDEALSNTEDLKVHGICGRT